MGYEHIRSCGGHRLTIHANAVPRAFDHLWFEGELRGMVVQGIKQIMTAELDLFRVLGFAAISANRREFMEEL